MSSATGSSSRRIQHLGALVESVEDVTRVITGASPADKAALYKKLGIELTYQPDGRLLVQARPRRLSVRVGGTRGTDSPRAALRGELTAAAV
jgi:hypothetical protein